MAIAASFPSIKPSLLLDFANVGALDPRITFTRSTTGTYYDGVTTAKAEENLLLRSQEFDNAAWTKSNSTVTANSTTAPDGTTTADTLTAAASTSAHYIAQTLSPSDGTYTYSIYSKAGTAGYLQLTFGTQTAYANFDLLTGVVGTASNVVSHAIESIGSGWYRCNLVYAESNTTSIAISIASSASDTRLQNWTAAGTETVEIWGAQLEQRSSVTAYTPTTTQPITNYIPVLQTAAAGQARFDHNPTTGEALGLLIEEQRTNLLTYSEQFDNAAWTKSNATITANTVVAPDGTLTADKLVEDTANALHIIGGAVSLSITSGTSYALSLYAKAAERSVLQILPSSSGFGSTAYANFDLIAGQVTASAVGVASITSVGNGWYRCTLVVTATATLSTGPFNAAIQNSTTAARSAAYTGDGYSGIYIWGAQLEVGSFPTSYIPTTSAQVTRNADAASMTGTNFSSWFNNGEGTLYGEAKTFNGVGGAAFGQTIFTISDNSSGNYHRVGRYVNSLQADTVSLGATQASYSVSNAWLANETKKLAYGYSVNDFNLAYDGTLGTPDTTGVLPLGVNRAYIGMSFDGTANRTWNGTIKKLAYYPQRLTDAQLQALTS